MSDAKIKLFVGTPSYGEKVCSRQTQMWLELGRATVEAEDRFIFLGMLDVDSQPIDRVRNLILAAARSAKADWLLMIDSDVWGTGDTQHHETAGYQILRMISQADRQGALVVGANVQRRGGEGLMTYRESPSTGTMRCVLVHELEPVDAVGTSLIAINVARLPESVDFRFADGLSEDLYFCKKVRELIERDSSYGPILVDGRVRTGHMKRPEPAFYSP